ncbi:small basic family protein [Ammonifex thiophilus]|uniref:DUF1290 domain-containing protein n=1 Tax=Ammonifex thiophilus TaxID=444093 RepID=A0A3D8P5G0_9THEO|nr:small basic family protein [Ammonifex thiophilus]RDV82910.1 DUF1290 domain-containing protein [Ammonifex thiophilus]
MWWGIVLVILGLVVGIALGLNLPLVIPQAYGKYLGVAVLAALDSVFGGMRASLEGRFDNAIFLSGFFVNACLAAGLVFLGDRLGVELYTAAIVAFGVRLFQNLAIIRRHFLGRKK